MEDTIILVDNEDNSTLEVRLSGNKERIVMACSDPESGYFLDKEQALKLIDFLQAKIQELAA